MSVQNVKRGDVVHNVDEFMALPVGAVVSLIDGGTYKRSQTNRPEDAKDWFPALVSSVPNPEWLEAAARAAWATVGPTNLYRTDWDYLSSGAKNEEMARARAAVEAADKIRAGGAA